MRLPLRHEAKPIVCYVTDRSGLPTRADGRPLDGLVAMIRRAIAAGVDWIQIRERDLPTPELLESAQEAVLAARASARASGPAACRILVNDRLDVALTAGTGGVHLGEQSMPVAEVTRWLETRSQGRPAPRGFLVGVSCHSVAAAIGAESGGADYVFFGPVFRTPSKAPYGLPQGLEALAEVCRSVKIPVLAIGGVTLANSAGCLGAGASGIAAIRLFQESSDIAATVARLHAKPLQG